jgi:outer membrane lipoprotein-sorting protein
MRKIAAILSIATVAVLAFAAQGGGLLESFVRALNNAETLSATYTVVAIGGTAEAYQVDLAKPNQARIDTPRELIIADGKTITTYDKANKTYYKRPQTNEELRAMFGPDELNLWASFFDAKAYANVVSTRQAGTRNRRGMTLNVLEASFDRENRRKVTFYLHQQDNVARQAEILVKDQSGEFSTVIDTRSVVLGEKADESLFAFKAPDGAREITEEELSIGRWYTDLDEAFRVAARTKRLLMVDFYADW